MTEQNTKTVPTDSQIDVLMSDWLGNLRMKSEGNYIHRGKSGIRSKKDIPIRDYLVGNVKNNDILDLMKKGRKAAEQVINTVTDSIVSVQTGGRDSFHVKDGNKEMVTLATDYFDDKSLSNEKKIDIMLGLAAHEASHSAYTEEMNVEEKIKKEPDETKKLKHTIWNIIEDERIEYHLGEDRPGFMDFVGETKDYYFKKLIDRMKDNGELPTEPIPKLISAITQAVRYPSEMTREQVVENFDDLDEIRKALTPYPLTPEAAWEATDRVMEVIRNKAKEEAKKKKEQQENKQQGGGDGNQQGDGQQSGENDKQDDSKGQSSRQPNSKNEPTEQEIQKELSDALSTSQGKKVMEAICKDIQKGDAVNESSALRSGENAEYVNDDTTERMQAIQGGYGNPRTFVRKPRGNAEAYNRDLAKVRQYIPSMSKALRCKSQENDYVLMGQKTGKLNTSKLASLKSGNTSIFKKNGSITCSSASVCILIDESGSMSGERCFAARKAAILVNEAIKRIPNVNFYCYGYTTEKLNVYSENGKTSPFALSETTADNGTPTGVSMEMAARRIRKLTKDPVLMLVMTDGCADSQALVRKMDEELRKKDFLPVGVGIQTNAVQSTFRDHISFNELKEFPMELGRLTNGKLDKMLIRTDSMA